MNRGSFMNGCMALLGISVVTAGVDVTSKGCHCTVERHQEEYFKYVFYNRHDQAVRTLYSVTPIPNSVADIVKRM